MQMRKLFAGLAAAATLLGGLAIGAATANAAEGDALDLAKDQTLTVKGTPESLYNHTFSAVLLAKYDAAVEGKDGGLGGVSLETNTQVKTAAETAINEILGDDDAKTEGVQNDYTRSASYGNPMSYVAKHWLGYTVDSAGDNEDSTSNTLPYDGLLRQFVTKLQPALRNVQGASGMKVGEPTATQLTFPSMTPGLYAIVDTTISGQLENDHTASIPMIVGTKVDGKDFANTDVTLGEVEIKNQPVSATKKITAISGGTVGKDGLTGQGSVGSVVSYELDGTVPNLIGYSTGFTYYLTDNPAAGLTLTNTDDPSKDVVVTVDGVDLPYAATYTAGTPSYQAGVKNRTATFDLSGLFSELAKGATVTLGGKQVKAADLYGKAIKVTYKAVLNDNARVSDKADVPANANFNTAKLHYSNVPGDVNTPRGEGKYDVNATKVYTYLFQFKKVAKADSRVLPGAEFQVIGKDGNALKFKKVDTDGWYPVEYDAYYKLAADQNDKDAVDTLVVPASGLINIAGVGEGTYTVKETKAPQGFSDSFKPQFDVTLTGTKADDAFNGASTYTNTSDTWGLVDSHKEATDVKTTITVRNVTSFTQLPKTGAAGIAMFMAVAALLGGAAATVFAKSRSAKRALNA